MAKPVRAGAKPRARKRPQKPARGPKAKSKTRKKAASFETRRARGASPIKPGTSSLDGEACTERPTTKQSPPGKAYTFTPELIAWGKDRWENSDDSQRVIALEFKIKPGTLRRYAVQWRWKPRVTVPRDLTPATRLLLETEQLAAEAEAAASGPDSEDAQASRAARADRLERALNAQIEELERTQAAIKQSRRPSSLDLSRISTSITRLIGAQFDLNRARQGLPQERAAYEDDMPADIDAFREDLARRIRAFVESRRDSEGGVGEDPAAPLAAPQQ